MRRRRTRRAPTSSSSRATTPGRTVFETVRAARARVGAGLGRRRRQHRRHRRRRCSELAAADPGLRVIVLPRNRGKGAAVLHGLEAARAAGFTHALTMDSDGQHPADLIPTFMAASVARSPTRWCSAGRCSTPSRRCCACAAGASRTGGPTSRRSAPASAIRCTAFASTRSPPLVDVMRRQRWMRRFDFDPEAVVRLAWRGVTPVNIAAPVKYLTRRGGRRLALPLRPRQRAADLDARAAAGRLRAAPAAAAWRAASPASRRSTRPR